MTYWSDSYLIFPLQAYSELVPCAKDGTRSSVLGDFYGTTRMHRNRGISCSLAQMNQLVMPTIPSSENGTASICPASKVQTGRSPHPVAWFVLWTTIIQAICISAIRSLDSARSLRIPRVCDFPITVHWLSQQTGLHMIIQSPLSSLLKFQETFSNGISRFTSTIQNQRRG